MNRLPYTEFNVPTLVFVTPIVLTYRQQRLTKGKLNIVFFSFLRLLNMKISEKAELERFSITKLIRPALYCVNKNPITSGMSKMYSIWEWRRKKVGGLLWWTTRSGRESFEEVRIYRRSSVREEVTCKNSISWRICCNLNTFKNHITFYVFYWFSMVIM